MPEEDRLTPYSSSRSTPARASSARALFSMMRNASSGVSGMIQARWELSTLFMRMSNSVRPRSSGHMRIVSRYFPQEKRKYSGFFPPSSVESPLPELARIPFPQKNWMAFITVSLLMPVRATTSATEWGRLSRKQESTIFRFCIFKFEGSAGTGSPPRSFVLWAAAFSIVAPPC